MTLLLVVFTALCIGYTRNKMKIYRHLNK